MFKDYKKYLTVTFKVYLFVLIILFIMKLVGLDYFGIDVNNNLINGIDVFITSIGIKKVTFFIGIMIYQYLMISIICCDNSKRLKKYTVLSIPFTFLIQYVKSLYSYNPTTYILEFTYLIVLCKIYNKNIKIVKIIKSIFVIFTLQFISNFARNKTNIQYETNYITNVILNLDYFVMLVMYQIVELGGGIRWTDIVGSFLQMKANLKNLPKKLRQYSRNFRKSSKQERLTVIIYFILSLIWNIITVAVVLIISQLNHTLIECIFILTSFWITKRTFGKPFHLSSMLHCFIVSNTTYYILNRITISIHISIIIPILLGVGLSYVTSKLVKRVYKPLYRGMPKDLFEETILKVVDKDSEKYKICYEYYINKKSALYLSLKYNYSEVGIRKIKDRVNEKIKGL